MLRSNNPGERRIKRVLVGPGVGEIEGIDGTT
jgi:hypothetical protein